MCIYYVDMEITTTVAYATLRCVHQITYQKIAFCSLTTEKVIRNEDLKGILTIEGGAGLNQSHLEIRHYNLIKSNIFCCEQRRWNPTTLTKFEM